MWSVKLFAAIKLLGIALLAYLIFAGIYQTINWVL